MSATVSVRQRSMSVTELLARTMISSDVAQMKPARSAALSPKKKNLPHARPFPLKDQVGYEPGKVVSLTLAQRPGVGMTLFAFDAGEAISTHAAPGDAMATILEGTAQITIDGVPHTLNAGEAVIMPAGIPHAVQAVTPFKMYLVVAKQ